MKLQHWIFRIHFLLNIADAASTFWNYRIYPYSRLEIPKNLSHPLELEIKNDLAKFFFFGDWGGIPLYPYKTVIQQRISQLMKKYTMKHQVQFHLGLGDNFYPSGVNDQFDLRFKVTFENVYHGSKIPWFNVLGNHDHKGNTLAQIQYTNRSKKWILPDYNYNLKVTTLKEKQKLIYAIFIDTMLICKKSSSIRVLANLERHLKSTISQNYPFLIVVGHHPVWSMGYHRSNQCLIKKLRPLLHKYKVNAYFSGHEHDSEHVKDTFLNWTVDYIINGASSSIYRAKSNITCIPKGSYRYFSNDLMFNGALGFVQADSTFMNISFIRDDGKFLYNTSVPSRIATFSRK